MLFGSEIAVIVCFLASLAGTWLTLRYAVRLGLVAAPNARSSHSRPTPTGGGLGLAIGTSVASILAVAAVPWPYAAILIGGVGMAAVGLWDDIRPVRWQIRLGAQFAFFGLIAFATLPPLLAVPALFCGVLFINIFNFMDGIDGLAGVEAAFVFLAAAWMISPASGLIEVWWLLALGAAVLGFIIFNFPPARIFMGDAGSTSLGLIIAGLALVTRDIVSPWCWLILVALFLSDGLVTLTRRLLQGERLFQAHRRHAYQIMSRRFGGHLQVTLGALAINVVWLLPIALAAHGTPAWAPWLTALAYAPLVIAAIIVGAGRRQPGEI